MEINLDIIWAVGQARFGRKIRREEWPPSHNITVATVDGSHPNWYITRGKNGDMSEYLTARDVLSGDWESIKE